MMVRIHIRTESEAANAWLEEWKDQLRRQTPVMTNELAGDVVEEVIENHPVETGEAVQGWREGLAEASVSGNSTGAAREELHIQNDVSHVVYLEYGTSHMRPFAMVRKSLQQISSELQNYWDLLFKG